MSLIFSYDFEKEFLNLQAGNNSLNRSEESSFSKKIQEDHIDINSPSAVTDACRKLISAEGIDVTEKTQVFANKWLRIEKEVFARLGRLFETDETFADINVNLSLNERCSYNYKESYFFVNMFSEVSNLICVHELLHFYTHKFIRLKVSSGEYNTYKESLTVLLNLEFRDLIEKEDSGYPQHQQLRKLIAQGWREGENIVSLTQKLFADDDFVKLLKNT